MSVVVKRKAVKERADFIRMNLPCFSGADDCDVDAAEEAARLWEGRAGSGLVYGWTRRTTTREIKTHCTYLWDRT